MHAFSQANAKTPQTITLDGLLPLVMVPLQ